MKAFRWIFVATVSLSLCCSQRTTSSSSRVLGTSSERFDSLPYVTATGEVLVTKSENGKSKIYVVNVNDATQLSLTELRQFPKIASAIVPLSPNEGFIGSFLNFYSESESAIWYSGGEGQELIVKSLPEGCYSAVVFPEEQSIVISRTTDGPPYVCDEILTYKLEYQDAKLVWVQKPTCKPNFANRVKKLEPMLMYCQPKNRLLCLATSDGFPDLWRFSGDGLEIAGGQLTDMPSASTGEKTSGVVNVNISPDGKLVSVVRRIMVRDIPPADKKGNCYLDVWEIESGKKVYSKTVESVGFPVACFVNDQQLMVHWNNVLTTVDLLGKAEISSMHVQLPVLGVSISPISNRKMLYVSNYRGKGFQYSILSY